MENRDSPLLILLAWFNYIISYVFSTAFLSKITLVLSIIASIFYIINQINNFKNKK
jgi:hypothetical protein